MADPAAARDLAQDLVAVAEAAGLPTRALLTDMDQVLGQAAGNALEVLETVDFLTGVRRDPRLSGAPGRSFAPCPGGGGYPGGAGRGSGGPGRAGCGVDRGGPGRGPTWPWGAHQSCCGPVPSAGHRRAGRPGPTPSPGSCRKWGTCPLGGRSLAAGRHSGGHGPGAGSGGPGATAVSRTLAWVHPRVGMLRLSVRLFLGIDPVGVDLGQ